MWHIGQIQTFHVLRHTPHGSVLERGGDEILLPHGRHRTPPPSVGERVRAFVHTDSEDRPVASLRMPKAVLGEMVCLQVVDRSAHGAFLDWGLDKDLFVPRSAQHTPMRKSEWHVVAIALDERTQRLFGSSKLGKYFDYDVSDVEAGDAVDLLVHGFNDHGAQVVVDGRHAGLVYDAEAHRDLAIGDECTGFVKTVRSDNRLDIRLRREGRAGALDAQQTILDALQRAGGFLPLHDGSSPEAIASALDLSKKAFKRAVGGLYKAGKVVLLDDGIQLRR